MSNIVLIDQGNRKLSHKKFRALLKKLRRKRKRQQLAEERKNGLHDDEFSDDDVAMKSVDVVVDENLRWIVDEKDRKTQHQLWLEREAIAQIEFEKKRKLEEEYKKQQEQNEAKRKEDELARTNAKRAKEAIVFEDIVTEPSVKSRSDGPTHNPEAPLNYGTEFDRQNCPFFIKTGACRFGDRCSRTHLRPPTSATILIPGMYNHFSITESFHDEYDTDIGLEYEDSETYQHFREFYEDVLPEFKKQGSIIQFKTCCNHEPHLRGNVYVQYKKEEHALEAFKTFNGRWYAGRQLSCEFTAITKWRSAICGLFAHNRCPKGRSCNFLHVFRNPRNEFREADFDKSPPREDHYSRRSSRHSVNYRYSRSRSPSPRSTRSSRHSRTPNSSYDNGHRLKKRRTNSPYDRSSSRHSNDSDGSKRGKSSHHKKKSKKKKKHKHKRKSDDHCISPESN